MRFFSIVAMFKNESSILKSWLDHYIKEGADHFYLIDNGSTDDFKDVLKQYQNKITLFSDDLTPTDFNNLKDEIKQKFQNKQNYLYNKYFLDLIKKECEYVLLCDIDEYLYTKSNKTNIKSYLVNKDRCFLLTSTPASSITNFMASILASLINKIDSRSSD